MNFVLRRWMKPEAQTEEVWFSHISIKSTIFVTFDFVKMMMNTILYLLTVLQPWCCTEIKLSSTLALAGGGA